VNTDPYNINFADVEATAKAWNRMALRVPGHCVFILDDSMVGEGWYKQFEDSPYAWNKARRFAVRLADEDEESSETLEELEAKYREELGV
jgi:hypothetical protein